MGQRTSPKRAKHAHAATPTIDLAGKLREIRQTLLVEQRSGLCLDCVVSRGETAEKGACRLGDCG